VASVVTAQGPAFGVRFPSNPALINVTLRIKITDTAAVPTGFPTGGFGGDVAGNYFFDITVQDFPAGATYIPGMGVGGDRMTVGLSLRFLAFTYTGSGKLGIISNQGTAFTTTNSNIDAVVTGWQSFNSTNIDTLKQRILLGPHGLVSNRVRVLDTNNNWEGIVDNGVSTETWSQSQLITPASGATATTTIVYPTTFAIDRVGYYIGPLMAAFSGPTSVSVGTSISATAFITNAGIALNTSTEVPGFAPVSLSGTTGTVILTANGSNFTGTGQVLVSARGIRYTSTN
jgi:hypothetical protein